MWSVGTRGRLAAAAGAALILRGALALRTAAGSPSDPPRIPTRRGSRSSRAFSKAEAWAGYLRLRLGARLKRGAGVAPVAGYEMRYLEAGAFAQLFREIFVRRLYDVPLHSAQPHIIDCGSNIGMSVVFFQLQYPDARILAFEPNPATFAVLERNVAENGLANVMLRQEAVSGGPGEIEFFVDSQHPGSLNVGVFAERGLTPIRVKAVRLSDYIDREVDLLKIDIEGAEETVLNELAESGKLRLIRNIVCEYHHHHRGARGSDRLSKSLKILEDAGFGYQINAYRRLDATRQQDVLIYAYAKGNGDAPRV